MLTHEDCDARRDWLRSLKQKATRMQDAKQSEITAGKEGEQVLAEWESNGVSVWHLPPDEHGILRISVGGGETPLPLNYCVFRGGHSVCVGLLRKALRALEAGPS